MRWRAESPLIEHHKGHHVSFRRCGERRILQHMTSIELSCCHKPMLHEFLQVAWRNGGRSSILLSHGSWRKGRQHLCDPGIFPYFPSFLLSPFSIPLSFFRHRERSRERIADGVKGYRGVQGSLPASNPATSVVKRLGPLRRSKGLGKLSLPTSPTPRTSCPLQ
jgi:hypothetical protein